MTATVTVPVPTAERPPATALPPGPPWWTGWRRRAVLGGALVLAYLLASFGLWWPVWTGHPTSTFLCGCGDPGQYLWFFAAPAEALRHGHLPFFTGADYHPGGVNMLDNPGVLGLAIAAAPVTWAFGVVAAVNVVLLVTPVLSALAGFAALRRWVRWWPAAALGGAFYGFSPFVVAGLEYVHLQTAFLVVPPLVLICLDELLLRQRRRPVPVGAALGVLLFVQFLVSPEMLALTLLVAAVGVAFLVAYGLLRQPEELRRRLPVAGRGLAAGAVVSLVLAAYPVWYMLAGPRHTVGAPWSFIAETGNDIKDFFVPGAGAYRPAIDPSIFGYFGQPGPATTYLGATVVAAFVATVVLLRRSRLVWFVTAVALVVAALSLGIVFITSPTSLVVHPHQHKHTDWWLPWQVFAHLPLVDEASPSRLSGILDLLVALVCAVGLDRLVAWTRRRVAAGPAGRPSHRTTAGAAADDGDAAQGHPQGAADEPASDPDAGATRLGPVAPDPVPPDLVVSGPVTPDVGRSGPVASPAGATVPGGTRWWAPGGAVARLLPAAVGTVLAAAVLVPVGLSYRLPLKVGTLQPPRWFQTTAATLPAGSVVLALPWGLSQTSVWQAVGGMRFVMAGGDAFVPGPDGHVLERPRKGTAEAALAALSTFVAKPEPTPTVERTVRGAMRRWGVTTVVVSRAIGPPGYAVGFLSAVLGEPPRHQQGAWVWDDVQRAPAPWAVPADAVLRCNGLGNQPAPVVAACVGALALPPASGATP